MSSAKTAFWCFFTLTHLLFIWPTHAHTQLPHMIWYTTLGTCSSSSTCCNDEDDMPWHIQLGGISHNQNIYTYVLAFDMTCQKDIQKCKRVVWSFLKSELYVRIWKEDTEIAGTAVNLNWYVEAVKRKIWTKHSDAIQTIRKQDILQTVTFTTRGHPATGVCGYWVAISLWIALALPYSSPCVSFHCVTAYFHSLSLWLCNMCSSLISTV